MHTKANNIQMRVVGLIAPPGHGQAKKHMPRTVASEEKLLLHADRARLSPRLALVLRGIVSRLVLGANDDGLVRSEAKCHTHPR